ncbi:MAG TPA: carbon storage regulator [Phycisphaerae bacterium]|nr:carbon storage regulator [Phycisphaerae bacterium]
MLCLTRRANQVIQLSGGIEIRVLDTHRGHVRLGITAPPGVTILRNELLPPGAGTLPARPTPQQTMIERPIA